MAAESEIKLFDKWETESIKVNDAGIAGYINLTPVVVPKSGGRHARNPFYKSKLNIVERLINKMFVSGHRGKKHQISSGHNVGDSQKTTALVIEAFEIIEKKLGKNPVEVLVRAVENSAPLEEVISYQKGGIFAREGVVTSPQRRVDMALRHIVQGSYKKSFNSKKSGAQALADELIAAYNNETTSNGVSEKVRREKESSGAR